MDFELTASQKSHRNEFRTFVDASVVPHANRNDRDERTPPELIQEVARKGYLGAIIPEACGGAGMDMITFGLLNEELGRGCSSLRSLLTVHSMVAMAVLKWGSRHQKDYWISRLAQGRTIAALALTEPNVGSDAKSVETGARLCGDYYLLSGRKRWITFGQVADLFLIFAQCEGKPSAFLVEASSPGFSREPISGILGVRASMLAELDLNDCRIPRENLVGRVGFGFSHVASSALDCGRYSVAWGCVGIAQACLEASIRYTSEREQFGAQLKDYQLIQQMITEMITRVKAARLLCYQAGYLKDIGDPRGLIETMIAKYYASTTATKLATHAVQIHGANGCSSEFSVERYLRDAKIMEIIEGSTQMLQINIAKQAYQCY